jgi:HEAT repeat protein
MAYRIRAAVMAALVLVAAPAAAQPRAFEDVVAQLKSPDAGARIDAVRLLADTGYPEAGPPIAQLLRDPVERVQREALNAELAIYLGAPFGARKRVALVMERSDEFAAQRAFDANWGAFPLSPVPLDVLTGLLTPLRSPNVDFRLQAIYALGVLGQVDGQPMAGLGTVVDGLAERLGDPLPAGRIAAARASGRMFRYCQSPCAGVGAERLGDALVHSLNDPDVVVQIAAMEALGQLRYARAVQAITGLFDYYKKDEPALVALDALSRIGHASSLPLFRAAMQRKELDARRAGIEGVGRAGDKDGLDAVEALASGKRSANEALAIAFARQRGGRGSHLDALVAAASVEITREQAQDYLVELGRAAAPAVSGGLPAATASGRAALLEVLAVIGTRDQLKAVEPLATDRDPRVAAAARRAVTRMRGR